jgi:hypothetical protein
MCHWWACEHGPFNDDALYNIESFVMDELGEQGPFCDDLANYVLIR